MRKGRVSIAVAAALVAVAVLLVPGSAAQSGSNGGSFSAPFVEPTVSDFYGYPRVKTDARCIERPGKPSGTAQNGTGHGFIDCKPAAGGLTQLPNGKNLYWDNLAGTENVDATILSEYGVVGQDDQTRVLDPNRKTWVDPIPKDGGARSTAPIEPIIPGTRTTENENDGSLFCSDANFLADGRIIDAGGTKYVNDPGNDATKFGSTELYGIENTRIFNPDTNRWKQAGSMNRARWYPTMTTLGDGKEFIASGLRRLVKPVNQRSQINPTQVASGFGVQEGQNERETETFNPKTGKWTLNGNTARRSLPLFPRTHLLPNGHVYYAAQGQAFNPLGQAFDEATWNVAASFNPKSGRWTDLGLPGLGASPLPGFRGSTFNVMMPLEPNRDGSYTKSRFITGGGVPNPPSPGGYFAVRDSYQTTVDTTNGDKLTSQDVGDMNPTTTPASGRWYGTGTLLPTGNVLATSGADRDEVAVPGAEIPVRTAELYDPKSKTWRKVATQNRPRTYHNTATLMPDGRVLVGGHATISNSYLKNITLPGGVTAPNGRDPTFEIYRPPYLSCPGKQASISGVTPSVDNKRLTITTDAPASQIRDVVTMRNTTITHVVDSDQRAVKLRILSRKGNSLTVAQAPNGNVMPPGPYMLFVNRSVGGCVKPSVARQLSVASAGKVGNLCLPRRARANRGISNIRLGRGRSAVASRIKIRPVKSTRRTETWCVTASRGKVRAAFDRRRRVQLVLTTAGSHNSRGILGTHGSRLLRPGMPVRRLNRVAPRRVRIGKGLYRLDRRSRLVIRVRRGKVRALAVGTRGLLRSRRTLRRYAKLTGL